MAKLKIRKTISIDPELLQKAESAATNDNRTFSSLISVLLKSFLKKNK